MNSAALSPVDELLGAAKRLTREQRLDLYDLLSQELDEDSASADDALPLSPEWMAEIDRRVAAVEVGTSSLRDWEEILQEARESLKRPA